MQNLQFQANLVSIIIPVYNAEKTLKRCLEAIINQTYKSIEVICIDDGSGDMSYAIMQEYAMKDARILCSKQTNLGPAKARYNGLNMAH